MKTIQNYSYVKAAAAAVAAAKKTNGHDDDGRGDRAQAKSGVSKLRKIERVGSMGWGGLLKYNLNG